jgi:hypothetical protein
MPDLEASVAKVAMPLEMGELPIVVWLLVWGARGRTS